VPLNLFPIRAAADAEMVVAVFAVKCAGVFRGDAFIAVTVKSPWVGSPFSSEMCGWALSRLLRGWIAGRLSRRWWNVANLWEFPLEI